MKTAILLALAGLAFSAGCVSAGGRPDYSVTDRSLSPAAAQAVSQRCEAQYHRQTMDLDPYINTADEYWDVLLNNYHCYQRHGLKLAGYRHPNGQITRDEFPPKAPDY